MTENDTLAFWKQALERQGIRPSEHDLERLAGFIPPVAPPSLAPKLGTEPQLVQRMEAWEVR